MGSDKRMVVFDAQEIVQLLLHYNDGKDIPLDVKLESVKLNQMLPRYIAFECSSPHWLSGMVGVDGQVTPLNIRYMGKRILALNKGGEEQWKESNNDLQ